MSTIKNGQILQYCHFVKIIKGPGTSFQFLVLRRKSVRNVSHTAHQYLTKFDLDRSTHLGFKRNKHNFNFYYVAMAMMMSQKFTDFKKTQTSRQISQEQSIFFIQIKTFINYTSKATL